MSDYDKHINLIREACDKEFFFVQVIVIKRYDDDGGMYVAHLTTWPETHDEMGWETSKVLDFLDDHTQFGLDLVNRGGVFDRFGPATFSEMPEEFRRFVTYNILPIEWHQRETEWLDTRIQLYTVNSQED
jgi:hypothetical protein